MWKNSILNDASLSFSRSLAAVCILRHQTTIIFKPSTTPGHIAIDPLVNIYNPNWSLSHYCPIWFAWKCIQLHPIAFNIPTNISQMYTKMFSFIWLLRDILNGYVVTLYICIEVFHVCNGMANAFRCHFRNKRSTRWLLLIGRCFFSDWFYSGVKCKSNILNHNIFATDFIVFATNYVWRIPLPHHLSVWEYLFFSQLPPERRLFQTYASYIYTLEETTTKIGKEKRKERAKKKCCYRICFWAPQIWFIA